MSLHPEVIPQSPKDLPAWFMQFSRKGMCAYVCEMNEDRSIKIKVH